MKEILIKVPDNPTNGDMIKAIFPNCVVKEYEKSVDVMKLDGMSVFSTIWWNTPYSILNGTQLPKDHGRLLILSEDAIRKEQISLDFSCQNWISNVSLSNATVAIIEADKKVEE